MRRSVRSLFTIVGITVVALTSVTSPARATPGAVRWKDAVDGPSHEANDQGHAVAFSPDGKRVFAVGQTQGPFPTNAGWQVRAFRAGDGRLLWSKHYIGNDYADNYANAAVVSADGTVLYVAGTVDDANSGTVDDIYTVAYDAATGVRLWAKKYNGPADFLDEGVGIELLPSGNVVVGGSETVLVDGFLQSRMFTIGYTAVGVQLWAKGYAGISSDGVTAMGMDPTGARIYLTGSHANELGEEELLTVAFSATTGNEVWSQDYSDPGAYDVGGTDLVVSPDGGEVYVTATASYGTYIMETIAYDAATGAPIWTGPDIYQDYADLPRGIAISPDGTQVSVVGQDTDPAATKDVIVRTLDAADGSEVWTQTFDGGVSDDGVDIRIGPDGTVLAGAAIGGGGYHYGVVAFSSSGSLLWSKVVAGTGYPRSEGLSPAGGNLVLTGTGGPHRNQSDMYTVSFFTH